MFSNVPYNFGKRGLRSLPLPRSLTTFFDALKVLTQPQPKHEVAPKDHHFPCYSKPVTKSRSIFNWLKWHQIQTLN